MRYRLWPAILLILLLAGVNPTVVSYGGELSPGFEWTYTLTVDYEGSVWNETLVVSVKNATEDLIYIVEEYYYEGYEEPYWTSVIALDSNLNVVYREEWDYDQLYMYIEYKPGIPYVVHPNAVGDVFEGEVRALNYNGTTGDLLWEDIIRYRFEAVDEVQFLVKEERIIPFFKVRGSWEIYSPGSQDTPYYTAEYEYYVNKDFILPIIVSVSTSEGWTMEKTLIYYKIVPDPAEKYPTTGEETTETTPSPSETTTQTTTTQTTPQQGNYTLTIAFNTEGNYTTSRPDAEIEVATEDNTPILVIPVQLGGSTSIELPPGTYILTITPSEGVTDDGVGLFKFVGWSYNGRTITRDFIVVRLDSDRQLSLTMIVYLPPEEQETTTQQPEATETTTTPIETTNTTTDTNTTNTTTGIIGIGGGRTNTPPPTQTTTNQAPPIIGGGGGVQAPPPPPKKETPFYKTATGIALIAVVLIGSSVGAFYTLKMKASKKPQIRPRFQSPRTVQRPGRQRQRPMPQGGQQPQTLPVPRPQPRQIPPQAGGRKKCPVCNAEIPAKARFCPKCGAAQPM